MLPRIPLRLLSALGLGLALAALWLFGPCRRRPAADPGAAEVPAVELEPGEKARVVVDARRREVRWAVQKSTGPAESGEIKGVRRAVVVVKEGGQVEVTARVWGFCLEPGLALAFDPSPRPAADLRFFYFGRWGAELGFYYRDHGRAYLAASYELARLRLFNTSLWAGLTLQKEPVFGVRVGF